ncbi:hypothetical protein Fmac_018154 [Flemingia macrophylla]|uniref:Uncharacterized protein n=1 Tax=Flemingia macrophylla TaxID=520843 RepID=A0ABD1M4T6_9FABA
MRLLRYSVSASMSCFVVLRFEVYLISCDLLSVFCILSFLILTAVGFVGYPNVRKSLAINTLRTKNRPLQDSWSGDAHDVDVQLYDACSVSWAKLTMPVSDIFVSSSFRDLSRTRGQATLMMLVSNYMMYAVSIGRHSRCWCLTDL